MIYIDRIPYGISKNKKVCESIIKGLSNRQVTVSSSGTTGIPKIFSHSSELMTDIAKYNVQYMNLNSKSVLLGLYSPRGIGFTSMALLLAQISNCDLFIETTVDHYVSRLLEIRPTHTLILPNVWKTWHKHKSWKKVDLSFIQHMQVGSDITPNHLMEDLRSKGAKRVDTAYGSSEVPPIIMSTELQDDYCYDDINPNIDFKIQDNEIVCKYKTQKDWWYSGDLVEQHTNGFKIVGRKYNMFKMDNCGDKVYPEQIEKLAIEEGVYRALCRKEKKSCKVYFTGEMKRKLFLQNIRFPFEIETHKVQTIEVDDNLRKVKRNQEISV